MSIAFRSAVLAGTIVGLVSLAGLQPAEADSEFRVRDWQSWTSPDNDFSNISVSDQPRYEDDQVAAVDVGCSTDGQDNLASAAPLEPSADLSRAFDQAMGLPDLAADAATLAVLNTEVWPAADLQVEESIGLSDPMVADVTPVVGISELQWAAHLLSLLEETVGLPDLVDNAATEVVWGSQPPPADLLGELADAPGLPAIVADISPVGGTAELPGVLDEAVVGATEPQLAFNLSGEIKEALSLRDLVADDLTPVVGIVELQLAASPPC